MDKNNAKNKKQWIKPELKEKKMTGHFMICNVNVNKCPPGTALRQLAKCF